MADCSKVSVGNLAADTTIFKRKFRWGLSVVQKRCNINIPEIMCKVAARPNISFEETEINMKNGKFYIPGKASWETITVTFYDVVGSEVRDGIAGVYNWVAAVYRFNAGIQNGICMGSAKQDYAATVTIVMYTGCGDILETWELKDAWPQAVNWNDLDYSSSEEATVEMTLRYADVTYNSNCFSIQQCTCTTC